LATLAAAQTVIAEITQTEAALSSVGGQPSSTPSEDQDLPTAVLPRATPDGNAGSNPDATPATPSLTPTPNRTATARVVSTEDALATAGAWSRGTVAAAATVIAVASIPPSPTLRPTATVLNTVAQFRAPLLSTYRITQEYGANGHKGVDLGAGLGTEVIASSSGQVVSVLRCTKCTPERPNFISQGISGADATAFRAALSDPAWGYGYGNAVIIAYRYGDLPADMRAKLTAQGLAGAQVLVMYAILSEITVEPGAVVGDGTIIGRVGNTGNSTGPHLHLEARLSLDDASAFFSLQAENPRLLFDL
jgi:murein DD-endopeptidase MepM/ murein hydrolase activator NlpD